MCWKGHLRHTLPFRTATPRVGALLARPMADDGRKARLNAFPNPASAVSHVPLEAYRGRQNKHLIKRANAEF